MLKNSFNVLEMFEMAKDIEKRGYELYSKHSNKTQDPKLKKLFNKLALDEKDHYDTFDKLEQIYKKKDKIDYSYLDNMEVNDYLKHLVKYEIFPKDEDNKLKKMNLKELIDEAINSEKNTILLYQELVPYNSEETREVLYRLIKEEKEHYVSLVKYKSTMNN